MTDNITLPRAVVKRMRSELYFLVCFADTDCGDSDCDECEPLRPIRAAITVLDAALAEPEQKPEPVAWMYVNSEGECEQIEYETPPAGDDSITPLYAAPPEPDAIARAVEAEREACAKVCEEVGNRDSDNHAWDAAYVIRARGSK